MTWCWDQQHPVPKELEQFSQAICFWGHEGWILNLAFGLTFLLTPGLFYLTDQPYPSSSVILILYINNHNNIIFKNKINCSVMDIVGLHVSTKQIRVFPWGSFFLF
jgi:hypothetical protein